VSDVGAELGAPLETAAHCDPEEGCITCGDVAVEMRILDREPSGLALCEANGARETVDVTLVEPVEAGDRVLVHAGAALARVGEEADPG
jgi:hydrogenase expression/formation protein HypC